jgi:ribonuclease-3
MEPAATDELEAALEYTFRRRDLLVHALTHSSLAYEMGSNQGDNPALKDNEQLEFLGDAVLGMVVAEWLYRAHPDMSEGQLTRLRAALVSRKHMAQVGNRLQLGRYMRLGRGEERSGGRKKAALLANASEALIAAVYLDSGLGAASSVIEDHVIRPSIEHLMHEAQRGSNIGDHKSALQEFLQSEHRGQPQYSVAGQSGPDHRKRFLVEVRIPSHNGKPARPLSRGIGPTKKHAEQEAARRALLKLKSERHRIGAAGETD